MEVLETTEIVADESSRKPPESQTLGVPDPPPPVGNEQDPEYTTVPELGFQPGKVMPPIPAVNNVDAESLAREPVNEVKTLGFADVDKELGLGLPAGEDTVEAKEDEVGWKASPFAVGDFVWGKIKSHQWWPGQVCDPSGAYGNAKKVHRKDQSVLVSYFGDDTEAWSSPSQLKPFAEVFHQMVTQSSSKSFTSAVNAALSEIGRSLESQLTCYCVPEEVRVGLTKYIDMNLSITNYPPLEFINLVKDVALDTSLVDMLQVIMLRSCITAFGNGCLSTKSWVYNRRKGIMDLVDKIDLDAPPLDLIDGKEEECWITESGVVQGPEISPDKSNRNKKKRSMAALIAEMDLDSVELSDDEEKKNVESGNKEETGVGRRERKKSKYLSPPYTYLSGDSKCLVSPRSSEVKSPKNYRALSTGSSAILKCNFEEFPEEEDEKRSPFFKLDGTSAFEILSEFLATAANPFHLKWNRSAKTVRGFFAVYRSSVYSSGSDSDAYQKQLGDTTGSDGKLGDIGVPRKMEEGKSENKRGRKRKNGANEEAMEDLGHHSSDHHKEGKAASKRKIKKEGANGEILVNLDLRKVAISNESNSGYKERKNYNDSSVMIDVPINGLESGKMGQNNSNSGYKKKKSKNGSNVMIDERINGLESGKIAQNESNSGYKKKKNKNSSNVMIDEPIKGLESGKMGQKVIESKEVARSEEVANGKMPTPKDGKLGQKRKRSKDNPTVEARLDLGRGVSKNSEEAKCGQKRKKKDATDCGNPAALILTFSPGITLPSKDDLISAFSKFGPLIESEMELLKQSGTARIVFMRTVDAEKAFNDKGGAFGPPIASYRLRYLTENLSSALTPIPVPKPPLPYIRKSLERMISTLAGTIPPKKDAETSDGLKPEARENLVGEMEGLLKKVNKMLTGPAAGTST